eukprot:2266591-Rhodomonas_salina.3
MPCLIKGTVRGLWSGAPLRSNGQRLGVRGRSLGFRNQTSWKSDFDTLVRERRGTQACRSWPWPSRGLPGHSGIAQHSTSVLTGSRV